MWLITELSMQSWKRSTQGVHCGKYYCKAKTNVVRINLAAIKGQYEMSGKRGSEQKGLSAKLEHWTSAWSDDETNIALLSKCQTMAEHGFRTLLARKFKQSAYWLWLNCVALWESRLLRYHFTIYTIKHESLSQEQCLDWIRNYPYQTRCRITRFSPVDKGNAAATS